MAFIRSQLIEVIEWVDSSRNTIAYRFPVQNNEIKNGAQLIVRESQVAIFVSNGQVADIFGPGRHRLSTNNTPILTKLGAWKYGFNSPFKAEVYFINTRQFTDNKWGTSSPIMKKDSDLGIVRLKSYGSFLFSINNPAIFVKELLGTPNLLKTDMVIQQLKSIVLSNFSDAIGETSFSALELASKYTELGFIAKEKASMQSQLLGITISQILIENISLPSEVEKALDNKTSINILGGNLNAYTQFQTANMIGDAAKQPNTMGSFAAGLASLGAINSSTTQASNNTKLVCPHCGNTNDINVKFCGNCGKKIVEDKVTCKVCNARINSGLKFCPECGANQTKNLENCPKCGSKVTPNDRFCIECGNKLK